jgi:hypothetical protein
MNHLLPVLLAEIPSAQVERSSPDVRLLHVLFDLRHRLE